MVINVLLILMNKVHTDTDTFCIVKYILRGNKMHS